MRNFTFATFGKLQQEGEFKEEQCKQGETNKQQQIILQFCTIHT